MSCFLTIYFVIGKAHKAKPEDVLKVLRVLLYVQIMLYTI